MKRLALAILLVASSVHAQDTLEPYTVQEGDTCGTIAERWYGSPRRYDRIHEHNPELGPMPHHLHAGQVLQLPLPRERGADATVTDARGTVRAQRSSESAMSGAHIGEDLDSGSRVSTAERSTAELTFRSSSVAAIREQTLVIVHGASVERVREEGTHAELREGSLISRLGSLSGHAPLVVDTPAAQVELHEGETSVEVARTSGDTAISTHSGHANVHAASASVEVPVGHGTVVHRGSPPAPPRPLPVAPSWSTGEGRSFLGAEGTGGTMRGSWLPAPNASAYRVEIARREDGRDLVFQVEVEASVTRFEAYHFPAGHYFVHVSTLDADRLEGRPARGEPFEVVGVRFLSPGEAAPDAASGPVDVLEELDALADAALFATSAPPPPEVIRGARASVPEGVVCAMGASEPSHELVLGTLGRGFLTCVDGAGQNIAGMDVDVIGIRATLLAEDGTPLGPIVRGTSVPVRIRLEAGAPDESAIVVTAADGGTIDDVVSHADAELAATITVAIDAPESIALSLAARDASALVLETLEVHTEDPPPPPPPPPAPPPFRLHEGLGAFAMPSWVGLRDEQRTGVGGTLGITFASARLGEVDPRVRMIAGVNAGFFDDYLRIAAVVPLDILGQASRTADRGARDVFFSIGSRVLSSARAGGFGLAFDVGMWAPTAGADGLNRGRLQVASDLSLRIAETVALRSRQAGIFDLDASGSMLWASAYGVDVRVATPLTIGVEGTMTIGHEDGRDWYAGGAGLALGLDLAPVFLSLAGRYGFGDDLWPTATIALNARASFDP